MTQAINYSIEPFDLNAHLFLVTMTVDSPNPEGQLFRLPAWIPGSYMIREFARNIVRIKAWCQNQPVQLTKIDKHTWQAEPCQGSLSLVYEVYAWDLSVRSAHLDQTHAFFNGTSVFLKAIGFENKPHIIDIKKPDDIRTKTWRVATALPEHEATRYGFGTYIASDYDELIDSPVELGDFILGQLKAYGTLHEIAITGHIPNLDLKRIETDLKKICETQIAFFEPQTKRSPVSRYLFLIMVVQGGYGGLEHRASTALLCSRSSLPVKTKSSSGKIDDDYLRFLGLSSHEYFHTWNVKRIKPSVFSSYDLQQETYTQLLWLFEGFTSYYDDLMIIRSGITDASTYFHQISNTINSVMRNSGRHKQSIAEASFDTWIKYYRQDENSPNALVSYYTKGSLVALTLDLTIRLATKNERSLDDVMHILWQRYGNGFYENFDDCKGITDIEARNILEEVIGFNLQDFFQKYIYGTVELPLAELFVQFGISMHNSNADGKPSLNIHVRRSENDCVVTHVFEGGTAHQTGISAGDVLIAIDGLRVLADNPATNLEKQLARYHIGETVEIVAFRRDELMQFNATLTNEQAPKYRLTLSKEQTPEMQNARRLWLHTIS